MILQDTNIQALAALLAPHMSKPVWPGLTDPKVKEAARNFAVRSGLWEAITSALNPARDIPVLKRSSFREYTRNDSRAHDAVMDAFNAETQRAALALWLGHPKAELDYLQDLIWAWCETSWWKLSASEGCNIDLYSSTVARQLAEYSFIFADQLEPEIPARISREVAARTLDIALDYKYADWWQTHGNNWNLVCNSNLIAIALYELKDPAQLAGFIHPICRRMEYAMDYFTDDGGCVEGVGYWEYGFINYVESAIALRERTGGAVNIMTDEKIARISRFPFAAVLAPPNRASFADGGHGYIGFGSVLRINQFFPLPELYQLVAPVGDGLPELTDIRSLALYRGEMPQPYTDHRDYVMPDLGYAKVSATGRDIILAALAGSNGVSHNHNDIGSFMVLKNGIPVLTDPGSPIYTAKTFTEHRYEALVCASKGHSVPIINGLEQQEGGQYYGTLTAAELNESGNKTVTIDLSHAYPDPTLRRFERQFVVETTGVICLRDQFAFESTPTALEEAFVTFEEVELQANAVKIGKGLAMVVLESNHAGKFEVESFSPETHGGRDPRTLQRIRFLPATLSTQMQVEFKVKPVL